MKKLVAYLVAGLPKSDFSVDLGLRLLENGVDILEVGMPFSDPIADGAVIEEATKEALKNHTKFSDFLDITQSLIKHKPNNSCEIYAMGYFNPFLQYGIQRLIEWRDSVGVNGFIIPDLPHEEVSIIQKTYPSFNVVSFVAPTTTKKRLGEILQNTQGFIYLVAYTGITGANKQEDLSHITKSIKELTKTPLYLGFGINKDNAKEQSKYVDGVIVGSAFVKILLENLTNKEKITKICNLASQIKEQINS